MSSALIIGGMKLCAAWYMRTEMPRRANDRELAAVFMEHGHPTMARVLLASGAVARFFAVGAVLFGVVSSLAIIWRAL